MNSFGSSASARRKSNARSIAAFGVTFDQFELGLPGTRLVHDGTGPEVHTIGYEGRSLDDLVVCLQESKIDLVVDIREKPISRRPEFRLAPLSLELESAGIEYESWPELGSPTTQRSELRSTGDFETFRKKFRTFALRYRSDYLSNLGRLAKKKRIALFCYERAHEECHRSVVAELLNTKSRAKIQAIV